ARRGQEPDRHRVHTDLDGGGRPRDGPRGDAGRRRLGRRGLPRSVRSDRAGLGPVRRRSLDCRRHPEQWPSNAVTAVAATAWRRRRGRMCGRYSLSRDPEDLAREFEVARIDVRETLQPDYNIAPTKRAPAVLERSPDGDRDAPPERRLTLVRWGLIQSRAKDPKLGN